MQTAFHAGEFAPALNARVDLAKYRSAAALMRNFFVDYRGGASSRTGTKYILQAKDSANPVRLIPFQASFDVGYVLEFGELYIRFYNEGSPVLEATKAITAATRANPGVITAVGHGYSVGDWVFITGVGGMTQLNNRYFIINTVPTANTFTLKDLYGVVVNTTAYGTYTSGGTAQRVYTLVSPYSAADLATLKFAQNVNVMNFCHPDYPVYELILTSAASWTISQVTFGSTVATPAQPAVTTTLAAGSVYYSYIVTAVDVNGQESGPSTRRDVGPFTDLRTVAGTNAITWAAVTGAQSYNVYKTVLSYAGPMQAGVQYGFIGNVTGLALNDTNIEADFSVSFPTLRSPFANGASVASTAIGIAGSYTTVSPTLSFSAPSGSGITATGTPILSVATVLPDGGFPGTGYAPGDTVTFSNGLIVTVLTVGGGGDPLTYSIVNAAATTGGISNIGTPVSTSGGGSLLFYQVLLTWGVTGIQIINAGSGYLSTPTITFVGGAATATAVLGAQGTSNPSVPGFNQQRLVLAAPTTQVQTFHMSQPGSFYNFNITLPAQADDAITGTLSSGQLNEIKSLVSMPSGLIMISNNAVWLINGGSPGSAITAIDIVANAQSYVGASDVPPIVANFDILMVQAKGSIIRDITYDFNTNIYRGTDISVLSSHLFYGYQIVEWAWAEEPFKTVWTIRNDGTMLTLTFLKEQDLIGWAHSDTDGLFKSVAVVTEEVDSGSADAVYTVVQRTINGQTLKYIERFAERIFTNGATDAWCVDAGLQYSGSPATSFTGGEHLAGETVTGLADGTVITPFVMAANGAFTLANAASVVTVGLAFTPELQTLPIDLGEPTVQGKRKKITAVDVRVQDTLGLWIGSDSSNLVAMKDLVLGNVGSQTNEVVTDLVTGDARTIIDPKWTVPGQYLIRQPYPLPATILGVIPEITVGDTPR